MSSTMKDVKKSKSSDCRLCDGSMNCCRWEKMKRLFCHMLKVLHLVYLMMGCGETLTNKMIVEKVMCTLTSHFDHVIVATQESKNLETMKLEDLVGSSEAREIRILERKGVQDSIQAL